MISFLFSLFSFLFSLFSFLFSLFSHHLIGFYASQCVRRVLPQQDFPIDAVHANDVYPRKAKSAVVLDDLCAKELVGEKDVLEDLFPAGFGCEYVVRARVDVDDEAEPALRRQAVELEVLGRQAALGKETLAGGAEDVRIRGVGWHRGCVFVVHFTPAFPRLSLGFPYVSTFFSSRFLLRVFKNRWRTSC
jgi:hypothetical protein